MDRTAGKIIESGTGHFRPKTRLLRTIGSDLISNEIVAVIELVRNSFDADASMVLIRIEPPSAEGRGRIEIEDDGHGMGRDVLLGPWLEPATNHKLTGEGAASGEISPRGRRRLGSKGVGRFASQKLGHHMKVVSTTCESNKRIETEFDWRALESTSEYLNDAEISWALVNGNGFPHGHGTRLEITDLTSAWTEERIEILRLALSRLVAPVVSKDHFRIEISVDGQDLSPIEHAIQEITPMYSLRGLVSGDGECTAKFNDGKRPEPWLRSLTWGRQNCGPFTFEISVWDMDRPALEPFLEEAETLLGLRDFRRLVRESSGINLYRDGFRILPYGEPGNDWLELNRRRVSNTAKMLSNNQVLGIVHLTAEGNPGLQDQTNREGLIRNEEYQHLRRVLLEIVENLETRRFRSRRDRGIVSATSRRDLSLRNAGVQQELLDFINSPKGNVKTGLGPMHEALQTWTGRIADSLQQYSLQASRGRLAGMVFSQLEHPLRGVDSDLSLLERRLGRTDLSRADVDDLKETVRRIKQGIGFLQGTVRRMDPIGVDRRTTKPTKVSMAVVARDVVEIFKGPADEVGVQIHVSGKKTEESDILVPVVQAALSNILDNAIYWAAQGKGDHVVMIETSPIGCVIANNGPLIAPEEIDLIFEPNFSTRADCPGLGLTLARDLMRSAGGDLGFMQGAEAVAFELILTRAK